MNAFIWPENPECKSQILIQVEPENGGPVVYFHIGKLNATRTQVECGCGIDMTISPQLARLIHDAVQEYDLRKAEEEAAKAMAAHKKGGAK